MKFRTLIASFIIASTGISLSAQTAAPFKVVASTSWTAAFARAAGARDIVTIAPLELKHPPEYEIKPSDLTAVAGAQFLVHSGYERFAKRLAETAENDGLKIMQVYTDNLPSTFKSEARKLAVTFGTIPAFEAWAISFDRLAESMKAKVMATYPNRKAAVHKYLKTYAEWLGFEIVGTFGPGESSPAVLLEILSAKPAIVIDNYHNISGKALIEALGVPYVALVNFPGKDGTRTIEDVFALNEKSFIAASRDVSR